MQALQVLPAESVQQVKLLIQVEQVALPVQERITSLIWVRLSVCLVLTIPTRTPLGCLHSLIGKQFLFFVCILLYLFFCLLYCLVNVS
jgi:hypothetical protein